MWSSWSPPSHCKYSFSDAGKSKFAAIESEDAKVRDGVEQALLSVSSSLGELMQKALPRNFSSMAKCDVYPSCRLDGNEQVLFLVWPRYFNSYFPVTFDFFELIITSQSHITKLVN